MVVKTKQARPAVSASQYRDLAEFRYRIRRFLHFSEQAARDAGLEPHQHQMLLAIKGAGCPVQDITVGYVADRLQIRHHSAVELVNRLEQRCLIRRIRGKSDRRQVLVKLTPEGEAKLEILSIFHLEELRKNGPELVRALRALMEVHSESFE